MDQLEHVLDSLREPPPQLAATFDLLRHRVARWDIHPPAPGRAARVMAADLVRDSLALLAAADGLASDVTDSLGRWDAHYRPEGRRQSVVHPLVDRACRVTARVSDLTPGRDPAPDGVTDDGHGHGDEPAAVYDGPTDPIAVVDTGRLPAVHFLDLVYGGPDWRAQPWRKRRGHHPIRRTYD